MDSMGFETEGINRKYERELEINLSYVFHILFRNWKRIVSIIFVVGLVSILTFKFIVPKTYKAEALILPPSLEGFTQFGALNRFLPGFGGGATPTAVVIALINSRTVAQSVVHDLKLDSVWNTKDLNDAIKKLKKSVNAYEDEDFGTIHISSVSRDPELASLIVNAYIKTIEELNDSLKISVNKPFLKVVDWASPPKKKWKPKPVLYTIIILFFTTVFLIGWIFYREMKEEHIKDFYDLAKVTEKSEVVFREISKETINDFLHEITLDLSASLPESAVITVLNLNNDEYVDEWTKDLVEHLLDSGINAQHYSASDNNSLEKSHQLSISQNQGLGSVTVIPVKDPLSDLKVGRLIKNSNAVVIFLRSGLSRISDLNTVLRLSRKDRLIPVYVGLFHETQG